ncbi:hypothetical protein LTR84_002246 [Exophiala bonariae]|uniref:Uncharacterized protein n=1 Tax=Exophiala bonariae TaxID=1690606 RepID=A0AAV9ND32_9EURO|nr:hypothetical protein LTR84_002246 [Exophiala bonariae]
MSLWSSYKSLPPKTRGLIGIALMVNASAMLLFSDQIEGALGLKSNIEQQQKFFQIQTVERETKG